MPSPKSSMLRRSSEFDHVEPFNVFDKTSKSKQRKCHRSQSDPAPESHRHKRQRSRSQSDPAPESHRHKRQRRNHLLVADSEKVEEVKVEDSDGDEQPAGLGVNEGAAST